MEVQRVQALAIGGISELPAQFVRPAHERPENSKAIEGITVPVISLSHPKDVFVDQVSKACSEWGFFLLTDHDISPSLIQRLQSVGEEFFQLSQDEKESYANDPSSGKFEGYGTKMTRNSDEKVEWIDYYFHLMCPPSKVNPETWPKNPPSYREVTEEYTKEMLKVTDKLLELLSTGLGVEGKTLKSHLGGEEIELEMKINFYPPCPQPELALGVEPHTDMSALTILVPNDVPGLQVWKDGNWVAVDYLPNALFVHVGDQIEVLSNGKYKSVLHRSLVNKERIRMSWAVFCTPPHEASIGPIPELLKDHTQPNYSTKTYAEYRRRKFNNLPQEVTEEYTKEMSKVTDKLLELLSTGLGVEGKTLKSHLGGEEIELEMKINFYPPCPQPELALGVEPHTDMSALTILVPNDVPGLQMWKDGNWVAVDYLPNALFVHVSDQIEVLSNGNYKSVLHRSLVNKERIRMSWAVFCTPPHEASIGPIPELSKDHTQPNYSTKTYAEYRRRKFNNLPQ